MPIRPKSSRKSRLWLVLMVVTVTACSHFGGQRAEMAPTQVDRVWPEPPAPARIAYVRSFSTSDDLGIRRGFFSRFLDFFTGRPELRIVRPMAVLDSEDGKIYVADPGINAVHRFDTRNGEHELIVASDRQALESPTGLARGARGEIFITDSFLGQVYVVPPGADVAEALSLDDAPQQPTSVVLHEASGRLFVVDATRHQVKVYTREGSLLNIIGRRGNGDGEFNFPSMIWLDGDDRLLVSDALNFRVQIFDLDGRFLGKFGRHGDATGDMARPKGVAADRHGHIYVVDALFHSMQLFNDAGDLLLHVGHRGNGAGEFLLPTGIFINRDNLIYVADSHNSRVQVFRYIGDAP